MMTGQIHLHFDMFYKPSAPNSRTQLLLYNSTDFLRVLLSQLLSLLNNFLNGTHHVEGLLRQWVVLTWKKICLILLKISVSTEIRRYFLNHLLSVKNVFSSTDNLCKNLKWSSSCTLTECIHQITSRPRCTDFKGVLPPRMLLKPLMVSFRGTSFPKCPVKTSATWKGWDRKRWIFLARDTVSLSSSDNSSIPRIAMMSWSDL